MTFGLRAVAPRRAHLFIKHTLGGRNNDFVPFYGCADFGTTPSDRGNTPFPVRPAIPRPIFLIELPAGEVR